jgi:hypothetical protein
LAPHFPYLRRDGAQFVQVYDNFFKLDGDIVDTCIVLKYLYLVSATGPYSLERFRARAREARFDVEEFKLTSLRNSSTSGLAGLGICIVSYVWNIQDIYLSYFRK